MAKMVSLRLDEGLLDWATEYAAKRGVSRTALLEAALESFQRDCEAGVPELREQIARVQAASPRADAMQGVGNCPERPGDLGHVWESWKVHPNKPCKFCGTFGRAPHDPSKSPEEQEGFFAQATRDRTTLIGALRQPDSVKGTRKSDAKG